MKNKENQEDEKHPAARNAEQLAWAVWTEDERGRSEVFAVTGYSKAEASKAALDRAESDVEIRSVDGPYPDSEPGVWKFEFVTEHRETVVVEAPNYDYASESAEAERDFSGEYVDDIRSDSRRLDVDLGEDGGNNT